MEIYIDNISPRASDLEVKLSLAKVIHTHFPSVEAERPHNFDLTLPRLEGEHHSTSPHQGYGKLVLATADQGERFLEIVKRKPIRLHGKPLQFRQTARDGIGLERQAKKIRLSPYQDPVLLQKRDDLLSRLRNYRTRVDGVEFGVAVIQEGRPAFSIEWSKDFTATNTECYLEFEGEHKILWVSWGSHSYDYVHGISMIYSSIIKLSWGSDFGSDYLEIQLRTPPTFEYTPPDPDAMRQRLSSLDDRHKSVVSYASLILRLRINTPEDHNLQEFGALCNEPEVALPPLRRVNLLCPSFSLHLFAKANLDRVELWLSSLDWKVAFQCAALLCGQAHSLDTRELLSLRSRIDALAKEKGGNQASRIVRRFADSLKKLPGRPFTSAAIDDTWNLAVSEATESLPRKNASFFDCFHVNFTPTSMNLSGPLSEQSNRVIRMYPSHQHFFVRVNFTEEDGILFRYNREVDGPDFLRNRVGDVLKKGFEIAGRHFDFLAYSQSALKEHAIWALTPFTHDGVLVTAETIRRGLGDFGKVIMCPARYGARLSQAFSSTHPSVTVKKEEVETIPDIETEKHIFTDGVGTVSKQLAEEIWASQTYRQDPHLPPLPFTPPAFQIRLGGAKGVVSLDPTLEGRKIRIRPSMIKFDAPDSLDIEISEAFDRPRKMYLNRQSVMVLEDHKINAQVFLDMQREAAKKVTTALQDVGSAARYLSDNRIGRSYSLSRILLNLEELGFKFNAPNPSQNLDDPFLKNIMQLSMFHILRALRNHARIPVSDGWTLVGVADVHETLEEGQVFVCIQDRDEKTHRYLEGQVMVSRSPASHPGDVQMVMALKPRANSIYATEPLRNCIVFSCKGRRPLPSCLSGGDLDGDLYTVTTNKQLFFQTSERSKPAEYEPASLKLLDRPSTIEDVADFIVEFMVNDVMGVAAVNHLVIADQSTESCATNWHHDPRRRGGIFHKDCIILSELYSKAVDYAKSGTPVDFKSLPRFHHPIKPDWMAAEIANPSPVEYYPSTRALGKLYRDIKLPEIEEGTKPTYISPAPPPSPPSPTSPHPPSNGSMRARPGPGIQPPRPSSYDSNFPAAPGRRAPNNTVRPAPKTNGASAPPKPQPPAPDPISDMLRPKVLEYTDLGDSVSAKPIVILLRQYATDLRFICGNHTISQIIGTQLSEEEVVVGVIAEKCQHRKKRADLTERMNTESYNLVDRVRGELGGCKGSSAVEWLRRSWIAWTVSGVNRSIFGSKSFRLIALGSIFDALEVLKDPSLDRRVSKEDMQAADKF